MKDLILKDENFNKMMIKNINECINFLFEKGVEFGILSNLKFTEFNPALPEHITQNFKSEVILFELANYTLQSAKIENNTLYFEAGFGEENFPSTVSIPLFAIIQITLENMPILINFSIPDTEKMKREKSKNIFSK
ncbi:MAG: hypothetical protein J6M21_01705 [Campylobacter sp.]|nr:hypothetical protein [Campylobacter sp.]